MTDGGDPAARRPSTTAWRAAGLVVLTLAAASPALAQGGPAGMFGATRPNPDARQLLTFQMTVSEALDSDVTPEFRTHLPGGNLPIGRRSNIVTTALDYSQDRRWLRLSAATAGFVRYSHAADTVKPGSANAQAGVAVRTPRVGTLSLSQGLSYSPSYLYQLLPGEVDPDAESVPPADPDYRIDTRESLSHRTRLGLTTGTGLGWRAVTSAQYTRADFQDDAARGNRRNWEGSTVVSYLPTRRGGVSFGYRYRAARFGGPGDTSEGHEFPLGFEFTPALTVTRRLAFKVDVIPTVIDTLAVEGEGEGDEADRPVATERRRRYPLQGDVSISYPFHFRWHLSAGYRRGVDLVALLSEPVVTDGARLRVAGVMGRRLDLSIQARYALGASVSGGGRDRLTTAQGTAQLRVALTRAIALSAEYLYYYYDFGGQRRLAPDLPAIYEQHSLRVGVAMFTHFFDR